MSSSEAVFDMRPSTPPLSKHSLGYDLSFTDTASSRSPRSQVAASLCALQISHKDNDSESLFIQSSPDFGSDLSDRDDHGSIPSESSSFDSDAMQIEETAVQSTHDANLSKSDIKPSAAGESAVKRSTPPKPRTPKKPRPSTTSSPTPARIKRSKSPPPSYDLLSWHESEITGHQLSSPDDDGTGINGVGFKPSPAMAYARSQKRKQQVDAYRAREAREARQYRIEKRRGSFNATSPFKQKLMDLGPRSIRTRSPVTENSAQANKRTVRFA